MAKNDSHTNTNDSDSELARDFRKLLNREKPVSEIEDPLYTILAQARERDENQRREIPVHGKESAWESIMESTADGTAETSERRQAPVTSLHSRRTWLKAAAAIFLVAMSSIFLVLQFSDTGPNVVVEAGSAIETVQLADGSQVTLRPHSTLYEVSVTDQQHEYSLDGEALFEVQSSSNRTFSVEAGQGRVVVTGTRFTLNDRNQTSQVYLLEGSVRFETIDGSKSTDLEPGEASEIDETMQLTQPFAFESNLVTGWTQNRLTFRDRQAGSIMRELEFHFNIQIFAPEGVQDEILGGTIQLDSAEQSLKDLGMVLGGTFERMGDREFEFETDNSE